MLLISNARETSRGEIVELGRGSMSYGAKIEVEEEAEERWRP